MEAFQSSRVESGAICIAFGVIKRLNLTQPVPRGRDDAESGAETNCERTAPPGATRLLALNSLANDS